MKPKLLHPTTTFKGTLLIKQNGRVAKPTHHQKAFRKLCKISMEFIGCYLKKSAIHGLSHLADGRFTLFEKILWFILLIFAVLSCWAFGIRSVDRFATKSTVASLERDFYYWNTTLPSVTVCPMKRLDEKLLNEYCSIHNLLAQRCEELFEFLEKLANSTFTNFRDIPQSEHIDVLLEELHVSPQDYMELIYNLTKENVFNERAQLETHKQTIHCQSGDIYVHVRQVLTEYGLCYMTNTFVDRKYSARYFIHGEFSRTIPDGVRAVTVKQGNYFDVDMSYNFQGFGFIGIDTFIHSPFEVMQVDHNYGARMEAMHHELECLDIITESDYEVSTTISQRKCRFQHESNLTHFPIYTKNLCLQECRLNLIYEICKCIPHFYPNRVQNPKPVCDYKVLRTCLQENETYFLKLYRGDPKTNAVKCNCLPNCRDTIINKRSNHEMYHSTDYMGGNGIFIAVGAPPTSRIKRQIIYSFTDLLVSIGGSAGLFLGFSVLGAVELVYYFSLRLFCFIAGYKL